MLLKSLSSYSKFTIPDKTVSIPMKFMVQVARNRIVRVCFDVKYGIVPYNYYSQSYMQLQQLH